MTEQELNQFKQSDMRLWGVVAVTALTTMLVFSSAGLLLPKGWNNILKETPNNLGTLAQVQSELRAMRMEFAAIKRESNVADSRLNLGEESNSFVSKRVRALEASIPILLEALPPGAQVDKNLITASINQANGEEIIRFDDDLKVSRSYLFENLPLAERAPPEMQQDLPEIVASIDGNAVPTEVMQDAGDGAENQTLDAVDPQTTASIDAMAALPETDLTYGVILGPKIDKNKAQLNWLNIKSNVGTLLLGLEPKMIPVVNESEKIQLVVGPLDAKTDATQLCREIIRQGYVCEAGGFDGIPLEDLG
ncbi:hypothetical protein MXMO3_02157 [Maritalea myrionectae]|uniref:SPOR domain-containing protein n=1 Tax=Maritalea myrionectae TaxID=454601 RepID=A0A2R4MF63_9HYPH|nr:hypothetical protein [Maritalea myrionectae]AVX04677.1 hypothetical protein MXMO3_02157 [Maritalea myrionectae]